jgi:hypothetical protein
MSYIVTLNSLISLDVNSIIKIFTKENLTKDSSYQKCSLSYDVFVEFREQSGDVNHCAIASCCDKIKEAQDILNAATKVWQDGLKGVNTIKTGLALESIMTKEQQEQFLALADNPKVVFRVKCRKRTHAEFYDNDEGEKKQKKDDDEQKEEANAATIVVDEPKPVEPTPPAIVTE